MDIQSLGPSSALSPGAHLWIMAAPDESYWARLVDWYLNLQVLRSREHVTKSLPAPLKTILTDCEIPEIKTAAGSNALMIASQNRLPNSETVFLRAGAQSKTWISEAWKVWERMRRPSVRLFLPKNIHTEDIARNWDTKDFILPLAVVTELKS